MVLHAEAAKGAIPVPVGDKHWLPSLFTSTGSSGRERLPSLRLDFEVRDGVPQCRGVHLVAHEDGREVLASDLKAVRIVDFLADAVADVGGEGRFQDGRPASVFSQDRGGPRAKQVKQAVKTARRRVTNSLLREVAEVYRANVDNNPTTCVAEHFGRNPRTARLYVKQARDGGFLGTAIPGRAGEK